jgi:hypothetical protein
MSFHSGESVRKMSADRLRILLQTGFRWSEAAEISGVSLWVLRTWWQRTGIHLCDPIERAQAERLIQANYRQCSPRLFDGLVVCSKCRGLLKPPDQRDVCGRPHRWACTRCRTAGRREWVSAAAIKRAVFEALQRRLPEMARLCEHRTGFQREREQRWLEQLEQFQAMAQRLHEAGLPRLAILARAAQVQLAEDELGDPPYLDRHNWGETFSSWGAWEGASSHQWRMVTAFFCRKVVWDGERLQVVLFGRRFVDPLLMNGNEDLVDQPLWRPPVHPLAFSHPAHREF